MNNPAIARSARRLRMLVWIGIGLIVAIYLLNRLGSPLGPLRVETHTDMAGWAGQALIDLTLLMFVIALVRLAQMLGAVADGPLFGPRVTRSFRGFAFWLFMAMLVDVSAGPAIAIAGKLADGGGRAVLTFELSDLLVLAGALFLFLLARMMEQARAIESELEEIV
ncbi:DUF2975 domain-containing protein [Sphingomonas sp. RB56-2]|uniref:DUF2975 domain-containing protein n=1 Tax=Sphingomonas brevis TaxID=2908206 RepID=A0ABT0SCC0_9SPHN|nr:DUF2975 domain-containing protein [Sphingomonas brevis]MCL6742053.1 DUF2975 domain-containing protein [Sphingomonas brevis]